MQVDVINHKLVKVSQLRTHPMFSPDGAEASMSRIQRAFTAGYVGVSGVRIPCPSRKIPGGRVTSEECLAWWDQALNGGVTTEPQPHRVGDAVPESVAAAEKELAEAGLL